MSKITLEAIDAIGKATPDDWILEPELHASRLPPKARLLRVVLERPALGTLISRYHKFDSEAKSAQDVYRFQAQGAAITSFLAIAFGSVLVLPGYNFMSDRAINTVCVIQAALLVASFGLSLLVGSGRPFLRWMLSRARAEKARLKLFKTVLAEPEPIGSRQPDELPLLPLQLEYFRRYLLDSQLEYYKYQGEKNRLATRARHNWRIAALALLVLSGIPVIWELPWMPSFLEAVVAYFPQKSRVSQHAFLGIAFVGAGLQGLLAAYAVISMSERNASRYRVTAKHLDRLTGASLGAVRARAAAGDRASVLHFAAAIEEELSSEHREWIALRRATPQLHALAGLHLPSLKSPLRRLLRRRKRR